MLVYFMRYGTDKLVYTVYNIIELQSLYVALLRAGIAQSV
jgi:hypothetical protein